MSSTAPTNLAGLPMCPGSDEPTTGPPVQTGSPGILVWWADCSTCGGRVRSKGDGTAEWHYTIPSTAPSNEGSTT